MKIAMSQRVCVFAAALSAVGFSYLQATGALGLAPAEFAAAGDSTVRAASYAFSIWGLIYAGLLAYGVYQLVPGWADDAALKRFGWPSAISMFAISAWLVAAGADWRWATVALISLAALALILPLLSAPRFHRQRDALLIATPLALLAGWLTIATGLNAVTVLTAEGFVDAAQASLFAVGGLTTSVAVAAFVTVRSGSIAYPLPVIWGLIAVFVAEQSHRPEAAWLALASALILAAIAASLLLRQPARSAV